MKHKYMDFRVGVAALALAFGATTAMAGDEEWSDISPPVEVTHFAAGAATDVLWAASETEGVYLTEDGGETWITRNAGLTITEITAIAAARSNPNRIVVAQEGGRLMVSHDRGGSWSGSASGAVNYVTKILFDPTDDAVVYALDDGNGAVLKSTNGGDTWTTHTAGLPGSAGRGDNTDLVIMPTQPETLYVATAEGVFRSDDAGETWTSAQGPELPSTEIVKLAEHPGDVDTVAGLFVVGSEIQFWRTNTRGDNWYRPGEDPDAKFRAQIVAVDLHDPSRLLVGGGNGVFGSVNAAHHWIELNAGLAPDVPAADRTVSAVAFDPHRTRRYFVVTEGTVQVYDGMIAMDLVVTGTATPDQLDETGETTTIEFKVENVTGEPATDVGFEFIAPDAFEIESWTFDGADCDHGGQIISCTIDPLEPGEILTGEVTALAVGDDGLHEFTISAFAAEREASPDNNVAKPAVRIGAAPAPPPPPPPPPDDGDDDGDDGGSDQPNPNPPPPPPPPRAPSSSGGGGNGGWLFLLAGAPLLARRMVKKA